MEYLNPVTKPEIANLSVIEMIERKRLLGAVELPDLNANYKIRAAIYIRVSSGPQANIDKASIPEQKSSANKVIEQNQWKFIDEYQDIKATTHEDNPEDRPGLTRALNDAKSGRFDVLIVWIDARLGRNSDETKLIRKNFRNYGVQLYSVKKPMPITDPRVFNPRGDKYKHIFEGVNDLMSESEMYEFAEKMAFGKMNKARKGIIPCKVGYGYKKEKAIDIEHNRFITRTTPVENELTLVRRMFNLYLHDGFGIRKIVEWLNEQGYRTRLNALWEYSTIRYILKNPIYAGKVRWGWRLAQSQASRSRLLHGHTGIIENGEHKSILSEEEFIQVQKKIEERAKLGGRAVSSKGLLTGIIKCGLCGGNGYVTSSPSPYAYKKEKEGLRKEDYSKRHYYSCSTVSKYGNKACRSYIISQKKIEDYVVNEIKKLANSPIAQEAFEKRLRQDNTKYLKGQITSHQDELEKLPEMKNRISVAYREGVMELNEYGKNLAELEDKENKIRLQINTLKQGIEKSMLSEEKMKKAIKAFRSFNLIWDSASFEKKKDLIIALINKVICTRNKIEIEYKFNNPS